MNISADFQYPASLLELDSVSTKALKIAMEDARRVLLHRVKPGTPMASGRLRSSWVAIASARSVEVSTDVPYAPYVESGGPPSHWPTPGPRTISSKGKVWSRQAEGGILKPITDDEEWLKTTVDLIVETMSQQIK